MMLFLNCNTGSVSCCIILKKISCNCFYIYSKMTCQLIASKVKLFADDTAVYLTTESLDKQLRWEFNPSKCQVVRVKTSRRPMNTLYYLHGQVQETVEVDISAGLSWNTHRQNHWYC